MRTWSLAHKCGFSHQGDASWEKLQIQLPGPWCPVWTPVASGADPGLSHRSSALDFRLILGGSLVLLDITCFLLMVAHFCLRVYCFVGRSSEPATVNQSLNLGHLVISTGIHQVKASHLCSEPVSMSQDWFGITPQASASPGIIWDKDPKVLVLTHCAAMKTMLLAESWNNLVPGIITSIGAPWMNCTPVHLPLVIQWNSYHLHCAARKTMLLAKLWYNQVPSAGKALETKFQKDLEHASETEAAKTS